MPKELVEVLLIVCIYIYIDDWQNSSFSIVFCLVAYQECIKLGVRKFNVNTEVRKAYMDSLSSTKKDLVHAMTAAKEAMKAVVAEKMQLFGSAGKAL